MGKVNNTIRWFELPPLNFADYTDASKQANIVQSLMLPAGAHILCIATPTSNNIGFWAEIHPEAEQELRSVFYYNAGDYIPDLRDKIYMGTVEEPGGIWHIYINEA